MLTLNYVNDTTMLDAPKIIESITSYVDDALHEIVRKYNAFLMEHVAPVCKGEQMPDLDAKTKIYEEVEYFIDNHPIQNFLNPVRNSVSVRIRFDQGLVQIIERHVSTLLSHARKTGLIKSVFKEVGIGTRLSYGIVLKDDRFENMDIMEDFLISLYGLFHVEMLPVRFDFMSEDEIKRYKRVEILA